MLDDQLYILKERVLVSVSGPDAFKFLQNLVTNDLGNSETCLIYAALLTPQGKYLNDFFVIKRTDNTFLIDIFHQSAEHFIKRLNIYKLRLRVDVELTDGIVCVGGSIAPNGAFFDPRDAKLGWRQYFLGNDIPSEAVELPVNMYEKLRVELCIPETNVELLVDKTFILEAGFERLSGVSFTKGCYVGQEVTARMRHKTELQKGFVKVRISGIIGDSCMEIMSEEKVAGSLFTRHENLAIAYLKFRYIDTPLRVGEANLEFLKKF